METLHSEASSKSSHVATKAGRSRTSGRYEGNVRIRTTRESLPLSGSRVCTPSAQSITCTRSHLVQMLFFLMNVLGDPFLGCHQDAGDVAEVITHQDAPAMNPEGNYFLLMTFQE